MLALTLEQAKLIGLVVVTILVIGALLVAWVVKEVTKKVAGAAILAVLALLVWSQRSSLQECADKVRENRLTTDTTCSFIGQEIKISARS